MHIQAVNTWITTCNLLKINCQYLEVIQNVILPVLTSLKTILMVLSRWLLLATTPRLRYHSNNPDYWVNSGLVATKEDAWQLFKAACEVVEQPASGVDPSTAACCLYQAQGKVVHYCSTMHDEAPPFWAALPKPATFMDCHQKAQSLMGLAELPANAPNFIPPGQDLPASMYQVPPKDQAQAQHCWEWERCAPAAKVVTSKPVPKPPVKSSVPQALAQPKASSS
ncbi:hypothetical protein P691DRAFT_782137 [Macrolepiota fuliginosa MF-IS2]|uniref:Uncharacterized protein n=1 Tax=Macrolepiota fuliginosa MF-IS2 TaxID=1400762 RepID=A0A9P5WZD9_9AGAR|nr:hypothetical protein P691DRAFT_782137 [Macrolepiota fuliginosa MF-IS2]